MHEDLGVALLVIGHVKSASKNTMSETRAKANFIAVRDPAQPQKILFRYDAERAIVEIKPKGGKLTRVDLTQYNAPDAEREA